MMQAPSFSLAGRRALVTGASSGIGRTLASGLAAAGASVIGVARRLEPLEDWAAAVRAAGGEAEGLRADLGAPEQAEAVGVGAVERFGPIDILVNAAGVNPRRPVESVTVEEWRATLDLNLSTPFFLARGLVPGMRAKGWGRILNIASLQASRAFPDGAPYGASKGGVAQLTRAMAEAWSRDGILCNALAPGFFPTDLTARVFEDRATVERLAAQTCLGRNGRLEDLIGPAVFFCSEAAGYVTGQVLYVDGGFTAK
ncbi:MAG: SDR family oxidoreductase [Marivibrio sp.]|uniref:SDR family NAD(P)-dependent oxidoreductase n=1 Tax=Marivibrio sp. TaxID=2039719 RepID=UPI0032F027BF